MLQHYGICGTDVVIDDFAASTAGGVAAACVVACFKATGIWRIATDAIAKSPVESTFRELLLMLKGQSLYEKLLLK